MTRRRTIPCVGVVSVACVLAAAQPDRTPDREPVDQGVGDVGLGRGRVMPLDLRKPTGFDRVFRLPESPWRTERFARQSGALIAVFPRSTYTRWRGADIATIPPGTVFYIGRENELFGVAPDEVADGASTTAAVPVDRAANGPGPVRPDRSARAPAPGLRPVPAAAQSMWGDEGYRVRRLAELIDLSS